MGGLDENMQSLKAENEKLKAWLWRYQSAKIEYIRMYRELVQLMETHRSAGAIEYTGIPSSGGGGSDLAVYMVQEEKWAQRAQAAMQKAHKVYAEISRVITMLEDPAERAVLSMRYLQLQGTKAMSWEEIANELGYDIRHIFRLHGLALKNLHGFLKDVIKCQ